ncbi:MAG: hypothetical protein CVV06_14910 [Gammaproteobacteria bacterium HGW-Gammaproteobacteria-10]|nr:MAG: hypothetical protein CVV06_14910 [Gammaproteobacteria bacterium HGW-Gammaproteobacteria-10]
MPEEASGCSIKALPAWSWHRAYMDVFTASFNGHPEAEFSSTMSILVSPPYSFITFNYRKSIIAKKVNDANLAVFQQLLDQLPL